MLLLRVVVTLRDCGLDSSVTLFASDTILPDVNPWSFLGLHNVVSVTLFASDTISPDVNPWSFLGLHNMVNVTLFASDTILPDVNSWSLLGRYNVVCVTLFASDNFTWWHIQHVPKWDQFVIVYFIVNNDNCMIGGISCGCVVLSCRCGSSELRGVVVVSGPSWPVARRHWPPPRQCLLHTALHFMGNIFRNILWFIWLWASSGSMFVGA